MQLGSFLWTLLICHSISLGASFKQQEGWMPWPALSVGVAYVAGGCLASCFKPSAEEMHTVLPHRDDTGSPLYGLRWLWGQNGSRALHAQRAFGNTKMWYAHIKRHLQFRVMYDWKEPGSASCASVLRPVETAKTDGVQLPVMKANT